MAISNRDIGSAKHGTGSGISYADIGSAQATDVAAAAGGIMTCNTGYWGALIILFGLLLLSNGVII